MQQHCFDYLFKVQSHRELRIRIICGEIDDEEDNDPQMKNRMYSANTLKNFRYGLNRILKSKGHLYDIIHKKTTSFIGSQKAFADALKELKAEGKAEIKSYPEIDEEGQ